MKSVTVSTTPPYTVLSRFYEALTPEAPAMNRHARGRILGRILPRARAVCDLGCGIGTTAIELARRGLEVYAVDASAAQCRETRRRCRRARVPVKVIHADMRRLSLPEPVDVVLCEFNPLNHLGRRSALEPTLRRIARALRPGGWLYFDLNMGGTYVHYGAMTHWWEGPDFCLTMRGGCDRKRRRGWAVCEWFVRAGRSWRRYRERLEDVWWTDREIRAALRRAGFTRIRSWDAARVRPPAMKSRPGFDRYYLAEKAGPAARE